MERGSLSAKELEVLALIAQGHDAKSASRELGVSTQTVYERLRRARDKVGAANSREAARFIFSQEPRGNEKFVEQKLVLSDALAPDAFAALSGAGDAFSFAPQQEQGERRADFDLPNNAVRRFPWRASDERVIEATSIERLRLIGELSVRLAMAFAAICLAGLAVSTLLQR